MTTLNILPESHARVWYNSLHTCISCLVCNYITLTLTSTSCTIKCVCITQTCLCCHQYKHSNILSKEKLSSRVLKFVDSARHALRSRRVIARGVCVQISLQRACLPKTNMYAHEYISYLPIGHSGIRRSNSSSHRHLGGQHHYPTSAKL